MMLRPACFVVYLLLLLMIACPVLADSQTSLDFEQASSLDAWSITGKVSVDREQKRSGAASLKVEPGAMAVLKLRDKDAAGRVEVWVYDDGTTPADVKVRRGGPAVGLIDEDGRVLTAGQVYAPYLSGDQSYALGEYIPAKKERPYFKVTHLGLKRTKGWHKWTFDFDADKGLSILHNDKDVNASRKRFDWNASNMKGFVGVVLIGDETGGRTQTLHVDDVRVALAGAMKAAPTPPPLPAPGAPAVPAKDPAVTGDVPAFNKAMLGKHPRLLFDASDLPRMRANLEGPVGKLIAEQFRGYLAASKPPKTAGFLRDATDGQRQGFWRMPTVAVHYALTGDEATLAIGKAWLELLLGLENWEAGSELDSGMSAANIMVGAALLYDTLYNQLEPGFREKVRDKLLLHARRMYHGGHLNGNKATAYWQGDPQNNHRWHRNAGLVLCLLAIYEGRDDEQWMLQQAARDLDYVTRWLPEDGTSHEGPTYMIFGGAHLVLACHASDRLLGTRYLDQLFFEHVGSFMTQTLTPDSRNLFLFGDAAGGSLASGYANFLYKAAATHRQADVQAAMDAAWQRDAAKLNVSAWKAVIWRDPALEADASDPPTRGFFPDIGLAIVRDGWKPDSAGAMFKAGPFGGFRLNAFRNEHDFKYINVAHDDPDANSFILWKAGRLVAETDRYSKQKRSANHNTILINGKGQMAAGRPEGGVWSQPATGRTDMSRMAYVTAFKADKDVAIIEGEASGSYLPLPARGSAAGRPGLERFRRTFIWVEGHYVLVLDDIAAPEAVELTWLMQAPQLTADDTKAHRYTMSADDARVPFRVAATQPLTGTIAASSADHQGKPLGWRQLQLTATTKQLHIASVYDLWGRGGIDVELTATDKGFTVRVKGEAAGRSEDVWQWSPAPDNRTASTVTGRRGERVLASIGPADTTPEARGDKVE